MIMNSPLKNILYLILLVLIIYISYEFIRIRKSIQISHTLIDKTVIFDKVSPDLNITLLVLGDSTAVGVGAGNKLDSIPALMANYINATYVENYAVSGAKVQDLKEQIKKAKLSKYNYILLQIGANDIVARNDVKKVSQDLQQIYNTLPESNQVIHICCGNIGTATIIPTIARNYYTHKTLEYHKEFENIDNGNKVTYINLYQPPEVDVFRREPDIYLAEDGFHPSSVGYKYWFAKMQAKIKIQR